MSSLFKKIKEKLKRLREQKQSESHPDCTDSSDSDVFQFSSNHYLRRYNVGSSTSGEEDNALTVEETDSDRDETVVTTLELVQYRNKSKNRADFYVSDTDDEQQPLKTSSCERKWVSETTDSSDDENNADFYDNDADDHDGKSIY